ncbi:MAG: hypothetical protein B7O98_02480 [Zestosphaera tikiterensis]|uniref:Metallo-beta-lactamase domain-containing protein n=1 Tax=Zestosphaera tikiterensis TaxID=1973259 RepID=A0A2R7Y701_9CREN|nr:MAG: hypothetical protein B7O98_02480 [Zestosphaera tikiterensis]
MKPSIKINDHGGILIDADVVIDGHEDFLPRVVTHIHSDHIRGLENTLNNKQKIVSTPLTAEWLKAYGYKIPENSLISLRYGEKVELEGYSLLLDKAEHIPGSAQVILENLENGLRIVYPGDFKKVGKGTKVWESDILIIDAVYGNPAYVREFDDFIEMLLSDLVSELLARGSVHIYGYYGKIQEVMQLLRIYGIDAPFILSHKQFLLAKIAENHGMKFGEFFHVNSSEAQEIIKSNWYVYFTHASSYSRLNANSNVSHVMLSGWEFTKPYRDLGNNRYLVAFSDHADFRGLVEYVSSSKPQMLVVNNVRSSSGSLFAEYIKTKLNIKSVILP